MRLGTFGARGDRRGLAVQTEEFCRHMEPARVLGIDLGTESPAACDWSGFDQATLQVVQYGDLKPPVIEAFFDGLDACYFAETPYRYEALEIASKMGVRTFVHSNFELCRWVPEPNLPRPDVLMFPAEWMRHRWPLGSIFMPFPVARERVPFIQRDEVRAFGHVIGRPAIHDRNGTNLLLEALQHLVEPTKIVIRCQSPLLRRISVPSHVEVEVVQQDTPNYWDLYEGFDVLVLPRRYGGQSLVMNEAASLGMPVISLDIAPQDGWFGAESLVPAEPIGRFRAPGGNTDIYGCDPVELAAVMDAFTRDPLLVKKASIASDSFAESISWERLKPRYEALFREY